MGLVYMYLRKNKVGVDDIYTHLYASFFKEYCADQLGLEREARPGVNSATLVGYPNCVARINPCYYYCPASLVRTTQGIGDGQPEVILYQKNQD